MKLVFYYDVVCPYAYLGSTQVEALAARANATLEWKPILLGGVFRAIGAPDVTPQPEAKRRLGAIDLQRWAALYDVPLAFPAGHPRRTVDAMRLLHACAPDDRVRLSHALYRAYWANGVDLSDRGKLQQVARDAGCEPAMARIDEPAIKDALRAATDEAVRDGVFGVPAYVVVRGDERTLYWGQDRQHFVERALTR